MRTGFTAKEISELKEKEPYSYTRKAREVEFQRSPALAALNELKKPQEEQDNEEQTEQSEQPFVMEELDRTLPPRSILFPSNYGKLTKIFYNVLVILFIGLFVSLLLWGRHMMTEGL